MSLITGIKPTGQFHLGNYVGFVDTILSQPTSTYLMIADAHAITNPRPPLEQSNNTEHIICALLACDIDLKRTIIYKQTDIQQIFQIYWLLNCFCTQGLLNRAHAFKAAEQSSSISIGTYTYATLMAADILAVQARLVPVGDDQKQHVEICRDIVDKIHSFAGQEVFVMPNILEAKISKLTGTDGRKMSKSYDNTLPIFADLEYIKKVIFKTTTTSQAPDEPKAPETLFSLYEALASQEAIEDLRAQYESGIAWKEVKERVFSAWVEFTAPKRKQYKYWVNNYSEATSLLSNNAVKVRKIAQDTLTKLQKALGL